MMILQSVVWVGINYVYYCCDIYFIWDNLWFMFQVEEFCVVVYVVFGMLIDCCIKVDVDFFFGVGLVVGFQ